VTTATRALDILKKQAVALDDGLTDAELVAIERRNDFGFSADHRELLSLALPTSRGWANWRELTDQEIRAWMQSPLEGLIFDVHNNDFWPRPWGRRPSRPEARERVARKQLESVPKLVPVFGHRFAPAIPGLIDAPVFSVHQADVIYYGSDLADYVQNELRPHTEMSERKRRGIMAFIAALARGETPTPVEPDAGEWTGVPLDAVKPVAFWSNLAEQDPDFIKIEFGVGRVFDNG